MGTKAVIRVKGFSEKVIGMTSDGHISNLKVICARFHSKAKELQVLTAFKKGMARETRLVMEAIAKEFDLFLCGPHEPQFVSYSAEVDPKTGLSTYYNGHFEEEA